MSAFNLTEARVNRGLSQRGLAREAGVGLETIRRLERGEGAHPDNARKVADVFGVQATDITPLARRRAS